MGNKMNPGRLGLPPMNGNVPLIGQPAALKISLENYEAPNAYPIILTLPGGQVKVVGGVTTRLAVAAALMPHFLKEQDELLKEIKSAPQLEGMEGAEIALGMTRNASREALTAADVLIQMELADRTPNPEAPAP